MKIRRIGIEKILHYDMFDLDFHHKASGLHVLYGPNETGKSTLLQVLLDALFGGSIHEQSKDFYDSQSRVRVALEDETGAVLDIERKRTRSRLAAVAEGESDAVEMQLQALLGGYDRDRYALLFGFDHARLRAGGQSLLQSGGHAGISLFEAGGGIQHLQNLLVDLTAQATNLLDPSFNPRSAKSLNKAWRLFRDEEAMLRKRSLRSDEWHARRKQLEDVRQAVEHGKAQLQVKRREQAKWQRVKRVRAQLAQLHKIRQDIADMGNVIALSGDVETRIPTLLESRRERHRQFAELEGALQQQMETLTEVPVDSAVIEYEDEVKRLTERLRQYESNREKELPAAEERLRSQMRAVERLANALAPGVGIEDVEMLRIARGDVVAIERLIEAERQERDELQRAKQDMAYLVGEGEQLRERIAKLGQSVDTGRVEQIVRSARSHGDLEAGIVQLGADIQRRRQRLQTLLASQTLMSVELADIRPLAVPFVETIDVYAKKWSDFEKKREQRLADIERKMSDLDSTVRELERLELEGHVPEEADLVQVRSLRDRGFELVKRVWSGALPEDGGEVGSYINEIGKDGKEIGNVIDHGQQTLLDAVEAMMKRSDAVVDQIWRDSTRFGERMRLSLQKIQIERDLETMNRLQDELDLEFGELHRAWQGEWMACGLVAKAPAEMKAWLLQIYQPLMNGLDEWTAVVNERDRQVALVKDYTEALRAELTATGLMDADGREEATLSMLLEIAELSIRSVGELATERRTLLERARENEQKMRDKQRSIDEKTIEMAKIFDAWKAFVERYPRLPAQLDVVATYLTDLQKLMDLHANYKELEADIAEKHSTCERFELDVANLASALGDDVTVAHGYAEAVRQFGDRLERAKSAAGRDDQIRTDMRRTEADIVNVRKQLEDCEQELDALRLEFGCDTLDSLTNILERHRAYRELAQRRSACEDVIAQVGDGLQVAELEAEAFELDDPDDLAFRLAEVEREIGEISQQLEDARSRLSEQQILFDQLDGRTSDAAIHAQAAEEHLATVDVHWQTYLRVELARRLLQRTIDDFRDRNQSAILDTASALFRRLTAARYAALTVEYDGETPYLEAVHQNGAKRRISQMSDGTRDQLFLVLRLAFIHQHLDTADPLPLVMDDILIHFDDERTEATLGVLAELAQRTQILYFTHHQRVVDLALGSFFDGDVSVDYLQHSLGQRV